MSLKNVYFNEAKEGYVFKYSRIQSTQIYHGEIILLQFSLYKSMSSSKHIQT